MPEWRNGRRAGLKIQLPQGSVGSTPTSGTSYNVRTYGLVVVKLRRTRQRRVFAGEWSTPTRGAGDCRRADDGQRQEVSAVDGEAACSANAACRSGERFQGKNC